MKQARLKAVIVDRRNILTVRDAFFKKSNGCRIVNEPASLKAAIQVVDLWRDRGPLSHAIAATADLSKAIVAFESNAASATCAQALANFVTGYTDTQQNLKRKRSMFEIGKNIGLPAACIVMRHRIVHGDMPSLIELQRSVLGALDWLWKEYWAHLGELTSTPTPAQDHISAEEHKWATLLDSDVEEVELALKQYQDRTDPIRLKRSNQATDCAARTSAGLEAVKKLGMLCNRDARFVGILVDLLMQKGRLIPERSSAAPEATRYWWWAFIQGMLRKIPLFGAALVSTMVQKLALSSERDTRLPYADVVALKTWLDYILHWKGCDQQRYAAPIRAIVDSCIAFPGPYTTSLALQIYQSATYRNYSHGIRQLKELQQWISPHASQVHQMPSDSGKVSASQTAPGTPVTDLVSLELKRTYKQTNAPFILRPNAIGISPANVDK